METLNVKLLDKDYQVACPPGQEHALRDSVEFLNKRMAEIRASGKIIGLERIAVMAALNISHEFLQADASNETSGNNEQIKELNDKLEDALQRYSQLEIE